MFPSLIRKILLIILLTTVAAYVSLPYAIPINIHLGPINLDKNLVRRNLDFSIGTIHIQKNFDLVLGLDLAGGSHLVFEADTQGLDDVVREKAIEVVKTVIEKRVNLFGISEPSVQVATFEGRDRIIVELPGVRNTNEAIEIIGKTAQLQFAEVGSEAEPSIIKTDLTGADLKSADVGFDQTTGKPVVNIEFNQAGAEKFAAITEKNIGRALPIILDEEVISAPIVQQAITGGRAQISGEFTLDQAKNLAIQLNAGALPTSINLVEQRTVGATLGAESVKKSVGAGLVGLSMVLIFMILSYGRMGLIADFA